MRTTRLLSAVAALSVAGGIAAATSAQADPALGLNVVPAAYYQQYAGPPQCWRWSRKYHHWSWICPPVQQYPQYYQAPDPFDLPFCCLRSDQRERHDH